MVTAVSYTHLDVYKRQHTHTHTFKCKSEPVLMCIVEINILIIFSDREESQDVSEEHTEKKN